MNKLQSQAISHFFSIFEPKDFKLPDKIIFENCLLISKAKNNFLSSLFNNWFTFSSGTFQYETLSLPKDILKIPIISTKSYDKFSSKASTITL